MSDFWGEEEKDKNRFAMFCQLFPTVTAFRKIVLRNPKNRTYFSYKASIASLAANASLKQM